MTPNPPSRYQLFVRKWGRGCGSEHCPRPGSRNVKVCLARGTVPCDVLFLGEAPGESENVIGQPFVGPAGRLMDWIINEATYGGTSPEEMRKELGLARDAPWYTLRDRYQETHDDRLVSHCLTNLVGCIPRGIEGDKAGEPDDEQVKCCSGRLVEFVRLARPRLIVCAGRLARDWLDPGYKERVSLHKVCPECRTPAGGAGVLPCVHRDVQPVEIPRIDIYHPAYMLRLNVANRGLEIQRAVVKVRNAVAAMLESMK